MRKFREKYNLLFAIMVCFVLYAILSWLLPTASIADGKLTVGSTNPVGLFGLIYFPLFTIGTFAQFGIIILTIGAFYGVMGKTGVYGKLVDGIYNRFKNNKKLFLLLTTIIVALISSVTGVPYAIIVVIPLLLAVLTKLGYNKITSVAATFGSILIGNIGSTFGYSIAGTGASLLGLEISTGLISRLALLVIVLALYIWFIIDNKETNKAFKEDKKKNKEEVKEDILFVDNSEKTNKSPLALKVVFILTFILAIVSAFNWNSVFKITIFEDFFQKVIGITVSEYPLLQNLFGLTNPFGYWDSFELSALYVIMAIVVGWVYNLSLTDVLDGMKKGAKVVLKPACYVVIANILFQLSILSTNGTMLTFVVDKLASVTDEVNFITATASGLLGSFFHNNFYYYFNEIASVYALHISQDGFSILLFILQGIYGIMMMVLPTSIMLVCGLSMMNVSFKEWIKYIWFYVLQIICIVLIISVILLLVA